MWETTILDAAVHPDGDWVATSGSDGLIHFWTLPDLQELGNPIETAVEPVNENTYMPDNVSPLAISPDGTLLAHVQRDGEVVLRDLETLEVQTVLERPSIPEEEDSFMNFINNSVNRFAFTKNSSAIAVLYTAGPALYGCADWTIEGEPHNLEVLLDGPAKAEVGEEVLFVATHIGTDNVHGHQFFINDVAVSSMSMTRDFTWVPEKPGTFEVTVLLDDGFNTGETSLTLNVE